MEVLFPAHLTQVRGCPVPVTPRPDDLLTPPHNPRNHPAALASSNAPSCAWLIACCEPYERAHALYNILCVFNAPPHWEAARVPCLCVWACSQPQKLLLRAALFLPPKPDEAQARAVRALEAAFVDAAHGWSSGFVKKAGNGSAGS